MKFGMLQRKFAIFQIHFNVILILILFSIFNVNNVLSAPKNKDPIHLVLKNINYLPTKRANKNYEILDFSILLPKKKGKSVKLSNNGNNKVEISNFGVLEQPPVQGTQFVYNSGYSKLQHQQQQQQISHESPRFEALTAGVPLSMQSDPHRGVYNVPIYGHINVLPTPNHHSHKAHGGYRYTNIVTTSTKPNTALIMPSSSPAPLPSLIKLPKTHNQGEKTEIYYHSSIMNYSPPPPLMLHHNAPGPGSHFEALTAPKPPVIPQTISSVIRNANSPHYQSITSHVRHPYPHNHHRQVHQYQHHQHHHHQYSQNNHHTTSYPPYVTPGPHGQYQVNYQVGGNDHKQLIHNSPTVSKEMLLNNIVYHDDRYNNGDNSDHDDEDNESEHDRRFHGRNRDAYEVQEQQDESKKIIHHHKPSNSFLINVEETTKHPYVLQKPELLDHITPQPLTSDMKFITPWLNSTNPVASYTKKIVKEKEPKKQKQRSNDERKQEQRPKGGGGEKGKSSKSITDEIRYFQDIFLAQNTPYKLEFGHVLDSPERAEQRYEDKDLEGQRFRGKIKWSDNNGGYGEHYWDFNHDKPFQ